MPDKADRGLRHFIEVVVDQVRQSSASSFEAMPVEPTRSQNMTLSGGVHERWLRGRATALICYLSDRPVAPDLTGRCRLESCHSSSRERAPIAVVRKAAWLPTSITVATSHLASAIKVALT